jgi:hypothetical protein
MKNIIIYSLFIIAIVSPGISQIQPPVLIQPIKQKTSLQKEGLKGYVSEVQQTIHEPAIDSIGKVKPGKRQEIFSENYIRTYNDTGNIEEEIQYKSDGVVHLRRTYEYDATDKLLEEFLYDANDVALNKYLFRYDLRGLLSERIVFKKNDKWQYTYDKAGNLIEEKGIKSDGKIDGITEYQYNDSGKLIIETDKTPEGRINIQDEFTYDEKGMIVKRTHSIKEIKQQYQYAYQLDEEGNWIQKVEYKSGKPYRVYVHTIKYQKAPPNK